MARDGGSPHDGGRVTRSERPLRQSFSESVHTTVPRKAGRPNRRGWSDLPKILRMYLN